ncbi:MAG: hypothetical protein CMH81_08015, partial [Nitrospiraceae bacterium]|nr:hypothetical protein [Nitrospiraceae bacterium]
SANATNRNTHWIWSDHAGINSMRSELSGADLGSARSALRNLSTTDFSNRIMGRNASKRVDSNQGHILDRLGRIQNNPDFYRTTTGSNILQSQEIAYNI